MEISGTIYKKEHYAPRCDLGTTTPSTMTLGTTQHDVSKHNDVQYNSKKCDTQHNNTMCMPCVVMQSSTIKYITQSVSMLSVIMLNAVMLNVAAS